MKIFKMEKRKDKFFLQSNKQRPEKNHTNQEFKIKQKKQKNFDGNREGLPEQKQEGEKKPFDKKTYRLKKYSKKYKLEKWEEQRKKKMLYEYQKSIKNDPMVGSYKPKSFDEDVTDSSVGRFVRHPDLIEKETKEKQQENKNPSKQENKNPARVQERFNKIKQDRVEKQQEIEKKKQERVQKLQEYKKKKHDRFKKLSKKTKKGQPVMTGRLELMLEKIQGAK